MKKETFIRGVRRGLPVGVGYFSVSFGFGAMAVSQGIKALDAALISLTNLTSAGQFAGLTLIVAAASLWEIVLTQLVINSRYGLMSLALSQRLDKNVTILGRMAMAYGNVYVAQVAMGADKNQLVKALKEAESYPGPSLVICYAPCVSHGLKQGMGKSQENMKDAVNCGYWHLYRYDPRRKEMGESPMILDSKEPVGNFRAFLMDQVRYSSLMKTSPEVAEELFQKAEADARERWKQYRLLAES